MENFRGLQTKILSQSFSKSHRNQYTPQLFNVNLIDTTNIDQKMNSSWKTAVKESLERYSTRNRTIQIDRGKFLQEEQLHIINATGSTGRTPGQTISRVLQELRDEGILFFSNSGRYYLSDRYLDVSQEELPEDILNDAVTKGNLLLKDVQVSETAAYARIRKGVGALRKATLSNYRTTCALCDIQEMSLLVTSHINRWADEIETRGLLTNTICFCSFHDRLFEIGFFSLDDDFNVIKRPNIHSLCITKWLDDCTCSFQHPSIEPSRVYLKKHRQRCGFE